MKHLLPLITTVFLTSFCTAQTLIVEGIIKDIQNQRLLTDVEIQILGDTDGQSYATSTDNFGKYQIELPAESTYEIKLSRVAYEDLTISYTTPPINIGKGQCDILMKRLPGYEFQVDVKELLSRGKEKILGEEIKNLKIEIFNTTSNKEIKVVEDNPKNTFEANFERGNHYTILLRKKGFFAKRIEVNVDIYGCILCFEGLGNDYAPEIEDAITNGNERGILLADIPMKRIVKDETIRLDNIYYDYNKWDIRPDARPALDKLVKTLKRNPIVIELGSHTDSRGNDDYNMTLSEKRAKSAVDYITSKGIKAERVTSKGYGESKPLNTCVDGIICTDKEYQYNRRTEFKVTSIIEGTSFDNKSLKQIIEEEKANKRRSVETINGL